jgi:hypothetical protein
MAYFDTIEYVDGGGSTQEVALKLTNLASNGGMVRMQFTPRSHAPSEFHLSWLQPPETGIAIPFKSRCKIYANRSSTTGAANSFSGGTILFQGRRTDNEGSASGSRVQTSVTLSDLWWDLQKVTFQITWQKITGGTLASPTYTTFQWPDCILFQPFPGVSYTPTPVNNTITTWQQIKDIISYAASYASGAQAVQVQTSGSAEFAPLYCSWYPIRSVKCAEALAVCLRPHPGVFTEVDYTTTPPTLHFRNRANLTAISLPYKSTDGSGRVHLATDIRPLNDLVPDAVRLYYKINGTYNGQAVVGTSLDVYPGGSGNSLLNLDYSIDVTGASTQETRVNFTSAAFDPTSLTLWRAKVPALLQQNQGGQIPNDGNAGALAFVDTAAYNSSTHPKGIQVIDDSGAVIDYSSGHYEFITEQDVFTWMTLSGGAAASAVKATVKAFFSYDKTSAISGVNVTDSMKEHEHHFRVLLTNAPSGTYVLKQTVAVGEQVPANLAQSIYTELADLQWKLSHEIIQVASASNTLPTIIKPGLHKINLTGGHSDWTTMNACPESVSIEFFRTGDDRLCAQHRINCGPVNHLEPGYLIQLTNLFINRDRARIDAAQRTSGTTASSQVDLTSSVPKENTTAAAPLPVESNHVYVTGGVVAGQVVNSAKEVSTILAATTPTPVIDATAMKTMKPREIKVCADDGSEYYIIVLASGGHTKP